MHVGCMCCVTHAHVCTALHPCPGPGPGPRPVVKGRVSPGVPAPALGLGGGDVSCTNLRVYLHVCPDTHPGGAGSAASPAARRVGICPAFHVLSKVTTQDSATSRSHMGHAPSFSEGCSRFAQTENVSSSSSGESCALSPHPSRSAPSGMLPRGVVGCPDGAAGHGSAQRPEVTPTQPSCTLLSPPGLLLVTFNCHVPENSVGTHRHSTTNHTTKGGKPKPLTLGARGVFLEGSMCGMLVLHYSAPSKPQRPLLALSVKARIEAPFG